MMWLPSKLLILFSVMQLYTALGKMNYILWNVLISWLLLQFIVPSQSYHTEVTIPVSSAIQLECDDGLRVINNIDVTIRRSNTTCWTTSDECTLPDQAIETIKEKCNKQLSCKVDIRDEITNHWCLQDYGYFNVWYACKTITDFSCDFETALCDWLPMQNNDEFQWKRGLRPYYRSPQVDHTTASPTGSYVYTESFYWTTNEGDIAKLESGYIIGTQHQCLSFWYLTTSSRDSLYILQNEDTLLKIPEKEYKQWHHIQIPLGMTSHKSYKLVLKVIHDNDGSYGAIVVDDILIENQKCNSSVLECNFETYSCGWKDGEDDDSDQQIWNKQNGVPQYNWNTGPSTDHSTASGSGYYMYLSGSYGMETTEYLEFQNFDISLSGISCLTFWYHMYTKYDYSKEGLNVTINDELVWTKFGNQGNKWIKATIDLRIRRLSNIEFIGILGSYNRDDIAIDDISLKEGTCEGITDHEDICVDLDDDEHTETYCPKDYLDFSNARLSFDPEKKNCSEQYEKTRTRLFQECKEEDDGSQKCFIDLSTDILTKPECFQLHEFRIRHTCEAEQTSTVSSITSKDGSSTGLAVGLVIGGLLLACVVILIVVLVRRQTFVSASKENVRNNIRGDDYIGCQDIALPQTADHSSHIQCTGMYGQSNRLKTNTQTNIVQHIHSNAGTANEFVNNGKVQVPETAVCQYNTFEDNQMSNDNEYSTVDATAETSFDDTIDNGSRTADSYMVLDPTDMSFNRTIFSNTPTDYEFAKPDRHTGNKTGDGDQYDLSDEGAYDNSGNNRHKELEDNIYNHAVDTMYDSGSHKRNNEEKEDTYDHFFGQKTEDDYDVSTTT